MSVSVAWEGIQDWATAPGHSYIQFNLQPFLPLSSSAPSPPSLLQEASLLSSRVTSRCSLVSSVHLVQRPNANWFWPLCWRCTFPASSEVSYGSFVTVIARAVCGLPLLFWHRIRLLCCHGAVVIVKVTVVTLFSFTKFVGASGRQGFSHPILTFGVCLFVFFHHSAFPVPLNVLIIFLASGSCLPHSTMCDVR